MIPLEKIEDVHFGGVNKPLPTKWDPENIKENDTTGNDEDEPIDHDVLAILGFDPDKL